MRCSIADAWWKNKWEIISPAFKNVDGHPTNYNLWHEVEMPRAWFEAVIDDFIVKYRRHMREEEEIYFPLALKELDATDWQAIEAEAAQPGDDPLFGGKTDAEYQVLHDRILRLAR